MSMKTRAHRYAHAGHAQPSREEPHPMDETPEQHHQAIEALAYELWLKAGKPNGDAARDRFWIEAETELTSK